MSIARQLSASLGFYYSFNMYFIKFPVMSLILSLLPVGDNRLSSNYDENDLRTLPLRANYSYITNYNKYLRNSFKFDEFPYGMADNGKTLRRVKRQNTEATSDWSSFYKDCGTSKGCIPEHCLNDKKCEFLVTWVTRSTLHPEYVHFQLLAKNLTDNSSTPCSSIGKSAYIAVGFSTDGPKSVTVVECSVSANNTRSVSLGWSSMTSYHLYDRSSICDTSTLHGKLKKCDIQVSSHDIIICDFYLKQRIVSNHEIFEFSDSEYFIGVTSGCDVSELKNGFGKGAKHFTTSSLIHFHRKQQSKNIVHSWFAKWHGSLMIVAWFIFIPNGIFFARYLKESLVNISILKYRVWFAGHTLIMFIGFILSFTGSMMIFQERWDVKFAWPTIPSTILHFQLGFVASFLLICQVLFGWTRFSGRKGQRVFAFIHMLTGLASLTLAMFCIGFSYDLGMPCRIKIYSIVIVIWNLICHVAMMMHFIRLDTMLGLYILRAVYPFPIPPVTYDELPGTKKRLFILILHMLGTFIISAFAITDYFESPGCECNSNFCRDSSKN